MISKYRMPLKPHIYLLRPGTWVCFTPGREEAGFGSCPAEAYANWCII